MTRWWCVALVACGGGGSAGPAQPDRAPEIAVPVEPIDEPILIGGHVDVVTSWGASCARLGWSIGLPGQPTDKDEAPPPCAKPVQLAATCSVECKPETPHPKLGPRGLRVHLLGAGAGRISVAGRADGKLLRKELAVTVSNPDSIAVECMSGRTQRFGPCEIDGVAALKPRVRIVAMLAGHATASSQWRINGRPAPTLFSEVLSLAVIYPNKAEGDQGVRPGTYTLEVSLGDKRQQVTFMAHD